MQFLNPAGAWAFLGAAAIVALYLLKRRYVEHEVPSTFLWRRMLADHAANRPIQKLKKNLLMFMQIFVALLLALSLMRPLAGVETCGDIVLVVDESLSMRAQGRMDEARNTARSLLDSLADGAQLTLIAARDTARVALSRTADRQAAYRAVDALEAGYGASALDEAVSLALAIRRESPATRVIVLSDNYAPAQDSAISAVNVSRGLDNRAITAFALSDGETAVDGVVRVSNYGAACDVTAEIYADGQLCDVRTVHLEAGGSQSVRVTLPKGTTLARAVLVETDALLEDNERYGLLRESERRTVAFVGAENVFMETALRLRDDITLVKTDAEAMANTQADLYVLDDDGIVFSLTGASSIAMGEAQERPSAIALAPGAPETLARHITLDGAALRRYQPLTGGTPVAVCGWDVVIAMDRESVVFGFDVHDSNLPVQPDFPLLIQGVLSQLLPPSDTLAPDGVCGQAVEARLAHGALSATVRDPSGIERALPCTAEEPGCYRLMQRMEDSTVKETPFVVAPPASESDLRTVAPSVWAEGDGVSASGGREWTLWLALAALMVTMLEWWVSRRGI